ncbi:MAG TPA: hypothetical protein VMM60_13675 [Ilumatobacter sp.]|nr:hypothetical protein [Ilumatobacter sp.]
MGRLFLSSFDAGGRARGRCPVRENLAFVPAVEWFVVVRTDGAPFHRTILFDTESNARLWLERGKAGGPMITEEIIRQPSSATTSRFLAKVAIGCLADRLNDHPGGLDYLIDEPNLDALRDHARRGTVRDWPVSVRRIYPANARWREGSDVVQRVWDVDIFQDDTQRDLWAVLVTCLEVRQGGS